MRRKEEEERYTTVISLRQEARSDQRSAHWAGAQAVVRIAPASMTRSTAMVPRTGANLVPTHLEQQGGCPCGNDENERFRCKR